MDPETSPFAQLVQAAAAASQPQRLLFIFAAATLPTGATVEERRLLAAGRGGHLEPVMCIEKALDELSDFAALVEESRSVGPDWQVVFAAALPGSAGEPPSGKQVERTMRQFVDRVHGGRFAGLLALDREGRMLQLD